MPWRKKATALDYVDFSDAVRALITGTEDEWVLPWWDAIDHRVVDVNAFCAKGPEDCAPLNVTDFLGAVLGGSSRVGGVLTGLSLSDKLACFARNRLFGAYCELAVQSTGDVCVADFTASPWTAWSIDVPLLPDTTHLKYTATTSTGGIECYTLISPSGDHHNVLNPAVMPVVGTPIIVNIPLPRTDTHYHFWSWTAGNAGTIEQCHGGTTETVTDYEPPVVVQPPSAIAPEPGVYPDIAALGRRLDSIQGKQHWLLEAAIEQKIATLWPLDPDGEPVAVDNELEIELDQELAGFVVTASNIGNNVSEMFGEPRLLSRLGRITFGNALGWMPPIDFNVSPLVMTGLPPGVDRVRVFVYPPATATVQRLQRKAPAG